MSPALKRHRWTTSPQVSGVTDCNSGYTVEYLSHRVEAGVRILKIRIFKGSSASGEL